MRIKNKELRQRRHRKEQKVKEAQRELRKQFENKPTPTAAAPTAKPKAVKKSEAGAKTAAKKETKPKAAAAEPSEKPKKAKKAE